jgi:hypothetical protein
MQNFMNFHGNRNGNQWKVYKKLGIPKENLPEWYIRPNVLGIKNPKTFESIEFLLKFFWFFQKNW